MHLLLRCLRLLPKCPLQPPNDPLKPAAALHQPKSHLFTTRQRRLSSEKRSDVITYFPREGHMGMARSMGLVPSDPHRLPMSGPVPHFQLGGSP
jgi:hypothetical protein